MHKINPVHPAQSCKARSLAFEGHLFLFICVDLDLSARLDYRILALLQKTQRPKKHPQRDWRPGLVIALFAFCRAKLELLAVDCCCRFDTDTERATFSHHPGLFRLRHCAFDQTVFSNDDLTVDFHIFRDLERERITFSRRLARYLIDCDDSELKSVWNDFYILRLHRSCSRGSMGRLLTHGRC